MKDCLNPKWKVMFYLLSEWRATLIVWLSIVLVEILMNM